MRNLPNNNYRMLRWWRVDPTPPSGQYRPYTNCRPSILHWPGKVNSPCPRCLNRYVTTFWISRSSLAWHFAKTAGFAIRRPRLSVI